MKPSAPLLLAFLLSVALVMAGLIARFRPELLPQLQGYDFGLLLAGYATLALAVLFKGE